MAHQEIKETRENEDLRASGLLGNLVSRVHEENRATLEILVSRENQVHNAVHRKLSN